MRMALLQNWRVGFSLVFAALVVLSGCRRTPPTTPAGQSRGSTEDPQEAARQLLHRDPDLAAVQSALQHVNASFSQQTDSGLRQLIAGFREERVKKGNPFALDADEAAEVDNASFTL